MKRLIRAAVGDWDEYEPREIEPQVASIVDELESRIKEKYGRRFKKMNLDVDDIRWKEHYMEAQVMLWNGDRLVAEDTFTFSAYSDYADESDYKQHITRTIVQFVDDLV